MSTQLIGGGMHIILPSPDFDDVQKVELDRINRKTRAGDIIVFRDPAWTHADELVMKFSYTTQKKLNDLLRFMQITLGQIITLIDHEGYTWNGVITTPNEPVGQPGRENYTAGFTFRGSIV